MHVASKKEDSSSRSLTFDVYQAFAGCFRLRNFPRGNHARPCRIQKAQTLFVTKIRRFHQMQRLHESREIYDSLVAEIGQIDRTLRMQNRELLSRAYAVG